MGKRKSSSKPAPKGKKDTLSTTFKCLFCNHDKAVSVTMDKKVTMRGRLKCKDCGMNYETSINNLSAAVDVYSDWVDACEEERLKQPPKERPQRNPDTLANHGFAGGARMTMVGNEEDDDEDADGEVDQPEPESDADSLVDSRPAKRQERSRPIQTMDADDRRRERKDKERREKRLKAAAAADESDDD